MGIIDGDGIIGSIQQAFEYYGIRQYLMMCGLYLIPFLGLGVTIRILRPLITKRFNVIPWAFWGGYFGVLIGIGIFIVETFIGFYTDVGHQSSTTGLVLLFVPIGGIFCGIIGSLLGSLAGFIKNRIVSAV